MDKPMIGIRQADGSFYEILGDDQAGRKRLVLSAARADQRGVRIELFRSVDGVLDPSESLGQISLDEPGDEGFQDIEFKLALDDEGRLDASAALPGQPPRRLSVDLSPFRDADAAPVPLTAGFDDIDNLTFDDEVTEPATLDLPDAPEAFDRPDDESLGLDGAAAADPFDLDLMTDLETTAETDDEATPEARRSDADILADEALADAEIDDLGADFDLGGDEALADAPAGEADPVPEAFDLPDAFDFDLAADGDAPEGDDEATPEARRSDADILADEALADAEVDDLGSDFDLGDLDAGFGDPEPADPAGAEAPSSFDTPDFDLPSFDADEAAAPPAGPRASAPSPAEDWEKISLDDLEPMEFMDTGDEISAPASLAMPSFDDEAGPAAGGDEDHLAFDDEEPLELGDLDGDLGDLSDLSDLSGLDEDRAPSALTDMPLWDPAAQAVPAVPAKGAKAPKAAKAAKAPRAAEEAEAGPLAKGSSDRLALVLSLAALSLMVLLILVLLFLNMIKAPQAPVIQPEVMRWSSSLARSGTDRPPAPSALDLRASPAVALTAPTVLEVPEALKTARITLRLSPGESVEDVAGRFGPPARVEGSLLSW